MLTRFSGHYYQSDRGKFDANLLYNVFGSEYVVVAYTDYDRVVVCESGHEKVVKEFADYYELPIEA